MRTTPQAEAAAACLECGFRPRVGGRTCPEIRDQMLARDFSDPVRWRWHRLAVETYCLQHAPYVASAKSLAAHLCGACIAFERGNDPRLLKQLNSWLSTNPPLRKPEIPSSRGQLTVGSLHLLEDPAEYAKAVQAWARSAWEAYSPLHGLAHEWIAQAALHATRHRK